MNVSCVQIKALSSVQKKTYEFSQFKSSQLQRNPPQTERGRYSVGRPRFREIADHQIRSERAEVNQAAQRKTSRALFATLINSEEQSATSSSNPPSVFCGS